MPKLTVEFNDRMNDMLEQLSREEGTTKVDVLRRALALYRFVEDEVGKKSNRKLTIAEGDKVIKEVVLH